MKQNYKISIKLSLAFMLLCVLSLASAQNKVSIGVKGGTNFSRTNQSEYYHYNDAIRYGYIPGREPGNYNYPVRFDQNINRELGFVVNIGNDSLSFQPELLFVQKGYKANGVFEGEKGKQNMKSYEQWQNTYLEVPLLIKFASGKNRLKVFVAMGPSVGFWSDSYYNRNVTGLKTEKAPYNFEDQFRYTIGALEQDTVTMEMVRVGAGQDSVSTVENRREISAVFAGGIQYKLANRSLLVFDLRYVQGLTDLYRYNYDKRPPYTDKITNRRIALSLSYLFLFKE
ncbi:porin family protein [Pontibacter sp. CAU 1760]